MKDKSPLYRADRLAFRFRRSGLDGTFLREFRNLDEKDQARLAALAELSSDEVPAIGCYFDEHSWIVVSSDRLIWSEGGQMKHLALAEITDATILPASLAAAGTKDRVTELVVRATGNRSFAVRVEAGKPLSGIWNALKMVASWNTC